MTHLPHHLRSVTQTAAIGLCLAASAIAAPATNPNPNPPEQYGPPTTGPAYRTWKNVRIDGGGFVSGLIPSAAPGGSLYARTDVGGAYRWISATKSWFPITLEAEMEPRINADGH